MRTLPRIALATALLVLLTAPALGDAAVRTTLLVDEPGRTVVRFDLAPPDVEHVDIDGVPHELIRLPGEAHTLVAGAPDVPVVARSLVVPDRGAVSARVVGAEYEERPGLVAPSKGNLFRTTDPASVPFAFGEVYERPLHWPHELASVGEPYVMRDHRGVAVRVHPVRYEPVSRTLRIYSSITVEVVTLGDAGINVLDPARADRPTVRPFAALYARHFLNAPAPSTPLEGGADYPAIDEEGDMLVICHDPWCESVEPLATHKQGHGIPVTVKPVSEIGNDHASIKSYIQQVYDTSDLAFVLLVGDAAQVDTPLRSVSWENGAADALYAKLAGNDDYPEILVGRFSASTAAEVETQVQRTIDYESAPATWQDWFWRGVGIASAEGAGIGDEGQSDQQHQDEIRDWLLGAGYTLVDRIYDPGATDDQVADSVNDGRGIINYTGHGSPTSWGTSGFNNGDVNALVNVGELPFVFSVACNNGEFHNYGSCFAETWLRATHEGEATGAVAMYASSVSQAWAPPMEAQDEFNLLLTDPTEPYVALGALCYAASSSMMDAYGTSGVEMFDTWVLFGDPSLQVVGEPVPASGLLVTPPDGFESEGDAGGPFEPASTVYTLKNQGDLPLDYEVRSDVAWIAIDLPIGTLDAGESIDVTASIGERGLHLDNGTHSGTIEFVNTTDGDGDTARPTSLRIGTTVTLMGETLDEDPGWSTSGEWEFGTPLGLGGGHSTHPDPSSGTTGAHVFGANLAGNVNPSGLGPFFLTAGPFDMGDASGVRLSFARWLNFPGAPYAWATVEVSTNGSAWTEVWRNTREVLEADWTTHELDVATFADGRSEFWVRWGYGLERELPFAGSGWNVDDVRLRGLASSARMTLHVEGDVVTWEPVAGALGTDLVRGLVSTLLDTGGDFSLATDGCVADDAPGTSLEVRDLPPAGDALFVLGRAVREEGPTTYQALAPSQIGGRDQEIESAGAGCP